MNKLNLNIPITIFLTGVVLFLLAPFEKFEAYSTYEIFIAGLLIELIGIAVGLAMFFRYKITEKLIKEI